MYKFIIDLNLVIIGRILRNVYCRLNYDNSVLEKKQLQFSKGNTLITERLKRARKAGTFEICEFDSFVTQTDFDSINPGTNNKVRYIALL